MSHEKFEVGEVAIGQNFTHATYRNGMECVILEPEGWGWCTRTLTGAPCEAFGYRIRWADGQTARQEAHYLRKRRQPQDWVKLCNLDHLPTRLQGEVA